MPTCAVASCTNCYRKTRGKGIIYHSFPKDRQLRKQWLMRCKRADRFSVASSGICSDHFVPDDYEDDLMNRIMGLPQRKILKRNALPSQLLPHQKQEDPGAVQLKNERQKRLKKRIIKSGKNRDPIYEKVVDWPNNGSFLDVYRAYRSSHVKGKKKKKKKNRETSFVPIALNEGLSTPTISSSTVAPESNSMVDVEPTEFITPDIVGPLSEVESSNRSEPESSMDGNLTETMTCEKFHVSESSTQLADIRIKQEPENPSNILSESGERDGYCVTPPPASNSRGLLFQSPVLIKEEIVLSEEDP